MHRAPFAQSLSSALPVALATIMLAACGPGDDTPARVAAANAPARSGEAAQAPDSAMPPSRPPLRADTTATDSASATDFASNAVAVVQASLAADSEQVAPVMSYAPGDDPPPTSTGNDSSSTATTNQ